MIKAVIDIENSISKVSFSGTTKDMLIDTFILLNICYSNIKGDGAKELYRTLLTDAVNDNDSPIWQEGLEK